MQPSFMGCFWWIATALLVAGASPTLAQTVPNSEPDKAPVATLEVRVAGVEVGEGQILVALFDS